MRILHIGSRVRLAKDKRICLTRGLITKQTSFEEEEFEESFYLTPLDEDILPSSDEISSIEAGLILRRHKLSLRGQLVPVLHCAHGVVLNETTPLSICSLAAIYGHSPLTF